MKEKNELLENFYNEKIVPELFGRTFEELSKGEKKRLEETFSFQWYLLSLNWKELTESFKPAVFMAYIVVIGGCALIGFINYLIYLGFRLFFNI